MQDELAALEKLQDLDLEILEKRKELEEIPANLEAMRRDVAHVGELLDKEKGRLEEAESWHREQERDNVMQNELLIKSKAKLQAARNEKEAKAAQREIDTIRRAMQEREEEMLKLMEAIESYRQAIAEHSKEFGELEEHLKASEIEGKERMSAVEARIGETDDLRLKLASEVPQKTLRLYERIHARLGRALVEADGGRCTACNINLPPQMYNEILRGDRLYQCPSCNRILLHKGEVQVNETPGA